METVPYLKATDTLTFADALNQAYDLARKALPADAYDRLDAAMPLVRGQYVQQHDDGVTWVVASLSTPGQTYTVNGTCSCEWAAYHPRQWCKHHIAVLLYRKALKLMHEPPIDADPVALDVPSEAVAHGIDPRFLVRIQGQPFVKFAGLLRMAHDKGLQELKADWTYNSDTLSLAHAVASFPFGIYEESGDATPENVTKKVAPHFRRVALTRAKARVLRDALGVDLVAVEELSEEAGS